MNLSSRVVLVALVPLVVGTAGNFSLLQTAVSQIALPFKIPQLPSNGLQGLEQKGAEAAIQRILDNELPLRLDATKIYPTVAVLPGGPFQPKPLSWSPDSINRPLVPGDYTVSALAFCSEYSVHQPGAGTAYVLAPLQGKAAHAISTLLLRGTMQLSKPPQQLQAASWAIQSGLTYSQMPKTYQQVIDDVIPEYKGVLSGNFLQSIKDTYQTAAKGTKLPPLEKVLTDMGQPGQLALSAMKQQDVLLRRDTTDQLREQTLFRGQESGVYTPVKVEEGPWSERIPGVAYMRFKVVGGNMASNNVLEIRILGARRAPTARGSTKGFTRVTASGSVEQTPSLWSLLVDTISQSLGRGAQALVASLTGPRFGPCGLTQDQLTAAKKAEGACQCDPMDWNFCPTSSGLTPAAGQKPAASTRYVDIYTHMCVIKKTNGIAFVAKPLSEVPQQQGCKVAMNLWQFVNTVPISYGAMTYENPNPTVQLPAQPYPSGSCSGAMRNMGQWYLDACLGSHNPNGPNDGRLNPPGSGDVIGYDEPTPYVIPANVSNPTPQDLSAARKQFYDVVMCGTKVMEAFTWTESGVMSITPGAQCPQTAGVYDVPQEVPLSDPGLKNAACGVVKNLTTTDVPNMTVLNQIATNLNCQSHPP